MKVRYSYSSHMTRRARDAKNIRKQKSKYPEVMKKVIAESDIILEVLDSRFIRDTRNIEVEKKIKQLGKEIIYVLNKSDLSYLKKVNLSPHVFVSCTKRQGIKELRDKIKSLAKKIKKPSEEKFDKIVVGVIGYPNTGKSSLINLLVGKSVAGTGAEAGFTKGLQKLRLSEEIILLDSPGVIPSEEYSNINEQKIGKTTILGGKSYSQVKDPEIVVANLIKEFPGVLQKYYKIKTESSEYLIEKIGRQKNFLEKGNKVNFDKTSRFILKEWQEGKIKV